MKTSTVSKLLAVLALGVAQVANLHAARIALVTGGPIGNAAFNLSNVVSSGEIVPGDGADTLTQLSHSALNAMSTADWLANYDTIVMPWYVEGSLNADWASRLLPYLNAGGSILWEDPVNIGDLAGSGIGLTSGNPYGGSIGEGNISLVAPFGDAGASGFYHIHYGITSATSDWSIWSTDTNGGIHGVYREFANGGRMVLGVSDNLYHPSFSNPGEADHRQLTLNQLNWLNTGSVTGVPTPDAASSVFLVALGLGALGLVRRRRS